MYRREFNTSIPLEDESGVWCFSYSLRDRTCVFTRIRAVPVAHKHILMMYIKRVLVQCLLIIWLSDLFKFILHLKKCEMFISGPFWFCLFLN